MKKVTGIYVITSPSGRVYVGQSTHVYHRFRFYRYDKRKGTQPRLDASFFKYGVCAHSFSLVHWLPNGTEQSRLDYFEQIYMDSYRKRGFDLLNTREAGSRGKASEESKRKFRASRLGHPVSAETREKLRLAMTGKRHTEAAKKKLSDSIKGKKKKGWSEETRLKMSLRPRGRIPWNKGKTGVYKPEVIEKIRAARAVQPKIVYTAEMRQRMVEAAKKRGISQETRDKINETKRRQARETKEQNQPCLNL